MSLKRKHEENEIVSEPKKTKIHSIIKIKCDGIEFEFELEGDLNVKDHKVNGKGTCKYPSGDKYEGEIKDSKKHGKGIYKYTNGAEYQGDFKDDKRHGKGRMKYANGN